MFPFEQARTAYGAGFHGDALARFGGLADGVAVLGLGAPVLFGGFSELACCAHR